MGKKVVQYCPSLGTPCGIASYTEMLCEANGVTCIKSLDELEKDLPTHLHVQHEYSIVPLVELNKIIVFCKKHNISLYVTMHSVVRVHNTKLFRALYLWLRFYRYGKLLIKNVVLKTDKKMSGQNIPTDIFAQSNVTSNKASQGKYLTSLKSIAKKVGQHTEKGALKLGIGLRQVDFAITQLLLLKNAHKIIVHSELIKRIWLELGARPRQIDVFHHPVKLFQTSNTLYSAADKKIHIGCFGFLRKEKCILEIIDACKQIKNCILHIYTSTGHQNNPLDYERKIIDQVSVYGWIKLHRAHLPLAEIVFNLSKCDINVWYASQNPVIMSVSGSIRQYLAAKRPVIASDVAMIDDVRDVIQCVPPNKPHLLAKAIINANYHTGMIEDYLQKHTWDKVRINHCYG